MSHMVEVVIDSIRVSLTNQQRIIILKEIDRERYLPIWIGPYEAEAITISLQEVEIARPQTHDLLKNIIHQLGAQLMRVEVISIRDDVFYGNLVIETNGTTFNIDSRTSDAFALAVRTHVPIFVAYDIMENDGIIPEKDLQAENPLLEETIDSGEPESEDRLSVFEDFLQNLEIDEGPEEPGDEEDSNSSEDDSETDQ
jgi:uncharacterized protein